MKSFLFGILAIACSISADAKLASPFVTTTVVVVQQPSPTFLLKGKYLPVEVNGKVNPEFVAHLKSFIAKDPLLNKMDLSHISIAFKMTANGTFIGTVNGFEDDNVAQHHAKLQLIKLLANQIKYKAAVSGGATVRYEMSELIAFN